MNVTQIINDQGHVPWEQHGAGRSRGGAPISSFGSGPGWGVKKAESTGLRNWHLSQWKEHWHQKACSEVKGQRVGTVALAQNVGEWTGCSSPRHPNKQRQQDGCWGHPGASFSVFPSECGSEMTLGSARAAVPGLQPHQPAGWLHGGWRGWEPSHLLCISPSPRWCNQQEEPGLMEYRPSS